ncbi:hypothetical protein K458DRAFT_399589 [Lentithecium fluviatile CBS 122367]|uniref:Uncharacterized protein n=1 Tax=Lentithecium fluviatile CBS 122367 TaxID=1168545 RepID=A0A6G1JIF6_9PLEO|nr:hypothetical protein K458DRAFT_399589 [Lentithecium fluviatile CBS 122367]
MAASTSPLGLLGASRLGALESDRTLRLGAACITSACSGHTAGTAHAGHPPVRQSDCNNTEHPRRAVPARAQRESFQRPLSCPPGSIIPFHPSRASPGPAAVPAGAACAAVDAPHGANDAPTRPHIDLINADSPPTAPGPPPAREMSS